jgi:hypothetical protein
MGPLDGMAQTWAIESVITLTKNKWIRVRIVAICLFFFHSPVPDLIDTLHAENNNDKLSSDTNMKDVLYSPVTLSRPLILGCAGNLFESTVANLASRRCTS